MDASRLLREADSRLASDAAKRMVRDEDQRCAALFAKKAAALCSTARERAQAIIGPYDERQRAADQLETAISDDERWILTTGNGARVWERTNSELKLAWRLDLDGGWTLTADGRLLGREIGEDSAVVVIDLASQRVETFSHVTASGVSEGNLLLANKRTIRRVDWATLSPRESVTTPSDVNAGLDGPFRWLGRAGSVIAGDTLVSLQKGSTLVQGQTFLDTSSDQSRILACSDERATVFDTLTGQPIAQQPVAKSALCGFSMPGLSPDGRTVVGLDVGMSPGGGTYMIVVAFDIATGKITRTPYRSLSLSTALDASIRVENTSPPNVCVHYGNMHWRRKECPWSLDSHGNVVARRPVRATPSSGPVIKFAGSEIDRTQSPDGKTTVIATYEDHTPNKGGAPDYRHLRLVVADASTGNVTGTPELIAGKFYFSWSKSDGETPPSVRFVDATHVLLFRGTSQISSFVFDLAAASLVELQGELQLVGRRFARVENSLLDLTTQQRHDLTPDAASFRTAREYLTCPGESAYRRDGSQGE